MTQTEKAFPATSALLGTSAGTIYTCPASTTAIVTKLSFVNTTNAIRTATVYIVRSGDSAATKNMVANAISLAVNDSLECKEIRGLTLGPGDTIQALSDGATALAPAGSLIEFVAS